MNTSSRFDPGHSDAIRGVLLDTVRQEAPRGRRSHRVLLVLAITTACLLVVGGAGYALTALNASSSPGGGGVAGAPTASAPATGVTPTGQPSPSSLPGNDEPAGTPSPTPTPTPTPGRVLQAPVILTPTQGQIFAENKVTVVISGTGTPGTNIYIAEYCTSTCTMPEELGQSWQTPIVVGADGRWSVQSPFQVQKRDGWIVGATAARVDAKGSILKDASGHLLQSAPSPDRYFVIGAPTG